MAQKNGRNKKEFVAPQSQDFTILDQKATIGHLRVKPNAICWRAPNQQRYNQVSIDEFAKFAVENGKRVSK